MLKREDKEVLIAGIRSDIGNASAIFLTNLIGLTSNDSVKIRKNVRDAQGKLVVTRNTLFQKAGQGTVAEKLLTGLKGPHAVCFAFEDAASVAKCLKEAGDDHEVVKLMGGILGEQELSLAQVKELASLPSRDEMLGTVLATFMAPISAFARVLFAIQEQKGGGASESTSESPEAEAVAEETTES